jgi:phosphoglycolate phosphatase
MSEQGKEVIQAVWFDLDGTLIDSLADLGEAVNRMLLELGFPTHENERFCEFIGDGALKLVERALPVDLAGDAVLVGQALEAYQRHYDACWHEQTVVYAGMMAVLEGLREKEVKVGVISNKPHRFTAMCVAHFFPGFAFEVVFGQREGVPKKPDPAAAVEAAAICGVDLGAVAYVGDSGIDMQFARAAGVLGIGVEWGFRGREELVASGAQHVVRDADELQRLLVELAVVSRAS